MRANLVAVQMRGTIDDYASGEAFRRRMAGLMEQAAAKVNFDLPTVV